MCFWAEPSILFTPISIPLTARRFLRLHSGLMFWCSTGWLEYKLRSEASGGGGRPHIERRTVKSRAFSLLSRNNVIINNATGHAPGSCLPYMPSRQEAKYLPAVIMPRIMRKLPGYLHICRIIQTNPLTNPGMIC